MQPSQSSSHNVSYPVLPSVKGLIEEIDSRYSRNPPAINTTQTVSQATSELWYVYFVEKPRERIREEFNHEVRKKMFSEVYKWEFVPQKLPQ